MLACAATDSADKGDSADTAAPDVAFDIPGFDTPESVLYDPGGDRYLVSEIVGSPSAHDGEGRVTIVAPDGTVVGPLVEGLDAPKGSGIVSAGLLVADIDRVVNVGLDGSGVWSADTIDGAGFLNDIAVYDLDAWVSDSSASSGPSVWQIDDDIETFALADGADVPSPNGLCWTSGGLLALSGTSLLTITGDGVTAEEVGVGSLDGIVITNDGAILVSSWEAQAVLTNTSGAWEVLVDGLGSPADIGYDPTRNRLLVPLFDEGIVRVIPL